MKCAVEVGSGIMIHIPSFVKIGFRHLHKFDRLGFTDSVLSFFQSNESRLNILNMLGSQCECHISQMEIERFRKNNVNVKAKG
jgi:hypothetical protein